MKTFKTIFASVAAVMLTGSLAFGQTMGGASGTPATGGGQGAGAPQPGQVEKDIDLPVDQPVLQTPPKPPEKPQDPPPTTPPENPPTIYGKDLQSENSTIFYVIDVSGSMYDGIGQYTTPDGKTATGSKMDRAKAELTKSVMSLPKNFKFNMLAFDCGLYPWKSGMQDASDANKNSAFGWISALQPLGATGTGPAMAQAFKSGGACKLYVLLTDGAPNCGAGNEYGDSSCIKAHLNMINGANSTHAVINTFGIGAYGEFKQFCIDVASHNGGSYTDCR